MTVRKHLLALGWTILSRPNAAMLTRLRYRAPGGYDAKSYCSLPDLVVDSAAASQFEFEFEQQEEEEDQIITVVNNNEPPPPPPQTKDEEDDDEEDGPAEPAEEEEQKEEDDDQDAVIAEYIALMARNDGASRGRRAGRLRDGAKRHLLAAGWTFWTKLKSNGREELRYRAPTGRSYISLHTACQAFKTSRRQAALPMTTASASASSASNSSSSSSKIDRRRVHATPATILRAVRPSRVGDGDEDGGTIHCQPPVVMTIRKKRKLIGDGDAVNVTMKKIKKKETCCQVVGADGTQLIKKSITTTTLTRKKRRRKEATASKNQTRVVLRPTNSTASACQRRSRTLLSVLIDKDIVVPRDKVTYRAARDRPAAKDGFITGEGIRCTCCNKTLTVAEFAAHATARRGSDRREAWARVFLKDGRSLSQCLVELMRRDVAVVAARNGDVRVKEKCSDPEGDSVCSICNDGGDLLLCDNCPSAFHHACVGLQATPEGDWFCPSCRCGVCGGSDFDATAAGGGGFTDKTIIYCDQCEREYHVGCVRRRGSEEEEESAAEWCRRPEEQEEWPWLCSPECGEVFRHLQGLAAVARERSIPIPTTVPTTVEGVSLSILRRRRRRPISMVATGSGCQEEEEEEDAAEHGQLCSALDVLHECFVTLIEPRTQTDLTADIVFNRESELRRLNFRGYYVVGLEKAGELITVGTLRVLGTEVAELPLVGTRFAHRRQGMCHLLVTELEKVLRQVGVRRLVLPAVPELLPMWTASLGFHPMTRSDVMEIAAEHAILSFQGTTMCHKSLHLA
ncbi:hypothetical protein BDA96_02G450400 [Sorghum bicolor]|uniref:PHD-type domain-containing protein n=3 Tax=Sorghum bicolor TaxID=4558 RepID=A0A1W0W858_SORBI|nr:hypothetical protein BDA96_02G450400 [Sorghum bicolor]OQU90556.1 hypothetical protein SORBI_3002G429900 [Sorghum bicolor]